MVRRVAMLYDGWLHRAPLLTKALTSATLFGVGDRIAQSAEAKAKALVAGDDAAIADTEQAGDEFLSSSTVRTLRMMVWGGCFLAPTLHKWLAFVDKVIPGKGPVVVAKKIALDMFFFAPQITVAFFVTTKCMEGKKPADAVDAAIERLPATLQKNYSVWPFAHIITFGVIPLQYRLLFSNCVSLWWSSFLSRMSSATVGQITEPEGEL